jgi:hypothetical protein
VIALLGSPLVVVFLLGATLLAVAVPLWRAWRVYDGSSTRRPFDASGAGLQPPPELVPCLSALMRLGFHRLGEAQLDIPGVRAVTLTATGEPRIAGEPTTRHTIFVFVDNDGTVVAETGVVPHAPLLTSFNSVYPDGSVVETMYPRGETIDHADFHSGHSKHSLDRAYHDQRGVMDRWRWEHGAPRVISTMSDYLRADADYRDRFAKRKLRGPMLRRQILPTALLTAGIVALAAIMLLRWPV